MSFFAKYSNAATFLECKHTSITGKLISTMFQIDFENQSVTEDDNIYTRGGNDACLDSTTKCNLTRMDDSYIEFDMSYRGKPMFLTVINRKTGVVNYTQINKPEHPNYYHTGKCTKVDENKF